MLSLERKMWEDGHWRKSHAPSLGLRERGGGTSEGYQIRTQVTNEDNQDKTSHILDVGETTQIPYKHPHAHGLASAGWYYLDEKRRPRWRNRQMSE